VDFPKALNNIRKETASLKQGEGERLKDLFANESQIN